MSLITPARAAIRSLSLQMDDVELLYAALSPLRLLPAIPQLAPIRAWGGRFAVAVPRLEVW